VLVRRVREDADRPVLDRRAREDADRPVLDRLVPEDDDRPLLVRLLDVVLEPLFGRARDVLPPLEERLRLAAPPLDERLRPAPRVPFDTPSCSDISWNSGFTTIHLRFLSGVSAPLVHQTRTSRPARCSSCSSISPPRPKCA
jgi:hypothetical protein